MQIENAVYPKPEQLAALLSDPSDAPILMLNLLKFRDKAVYADGRETSLTGREAYQLYGDLMTPFVESHGGKLHLAAHVGALVIGAADEMWDMAAVMEYPSAAAFVKIATSPDVAAFGVHREAGLAGQLLIQCRAR